MAYFQPPEFDWDSKTVGLTISMFSYGYLGSLAGGTLATKFGGAMTYGISLMMAGLLTMLNPVCLNLHFYAFLACRALTGLFDVIFQLLECQGDHGHDLLCY